MLRTSTLLIAAITLAVPASGYAETKKQKKERKEKEAAEKAEAEAAALAEAEAAEKAAAEAAAAPPAEETPAEDASGAAAVEAPVMGGVAGSWPQRIKDRPINMLKGMIRGQGTLTIAKTPGTPPVPPATMGTEGSTGVGLGIGAGYGISDKLEAGLSYGISLKEFSAKGPLALYGLFSLKHSEKMRVSAGASFGYDLGAEKLGIAAGLAFQYHLNDKMYAYMPPTHIGLGFDPTTFGINLPVGFAFQVNEKINAFAETNLFDLNIEPSGSSFIFADRTPLAIGGFFSPSNKMDIGAVFAMPNVPDVADVFAIALTARLYFGSVPGSAGAAAAAVTEPEVDMAPPPME